MTALNPIKINVNDVFKFTTEGRRVLKSLIKVEPILGRLDEFKVVKVKQSYAEDEHTECREITYGAVEIQHIKTGKIFDIEDPMLDEKDVFWAFFTTFTQELVE